MTTPNDATTTTAPARVTPPPTPDDAATHAAASTPSEPTTPGPPGPMEPATHAEGSEPTRSAAHPPAPAPTEPATHVGSSTPTRSATHAAASTPSEPTTPGLSGPTDPTPAQSPARAAAAPAFDRARRRDRRVYTRSHPLLFALLALTRGRPVRRIGGALLVHGPDAYREALTRLPLDRTAAGTTGGAARAALAASGAHEGGVLFDQEGRGHRSGRRGLAEELGTAGTEQLRAVWQPLLARRLAPLAQGAEVDLVELARELSGSVVCALLGSDADPVAVADAAAEAAAASVRSHLPGPPRPRAATATARATARLQQLLGTADDRDDALSAMVAVAAVNTTVAALPRAAAWCADAGLWDQAADPILRQDLADELLRVTAPSPLLPRVAAADGAVGGCPVRSGDRLVLIARHAVGAHRRDPDAREPAEPDLSHLVFGAGPHTCPGARLARVQLADVLAVLAPHRPVVVRAKVDRRAALPGWRSLTVRAGR